MFRVGQKVVCIHTGACPYGETAPTLGEVYTIRDAEMHRNGAGYRLVEIVNPPGDYLQGFVECSFAHFCFRPVVERKTDISIFTGMLSPKKQKVRA